MPSAKSRKTAATSPAEVQVPESQQGITPRLLTVKQAAVYLSATVWAVRELLWSDAIPHVIIGKRFLVDRGDLDRWIDKQLSNCAQQAKATANRITHRTQAAA